MRSGLALNGALFNTERMLCQYLTKADAGVVVRRGDYPQKFVVRN